MQWDEFEKSLAQTEPPGGLSAPLKALWLDARDRWDAAHALVQEERTAEAAWVHAYLHRKEGDLSNARFWYAKTDHVMPESTLEQEWGSIARRLLETS